MHARFIAYRALPFLGLLAFDAALFGWSYENGPAPVSNLTVNILVAVYFLMPFVILIGGGHVMRQFKPRSSFGNAMLSLSFLVALVHPWVALVTASEIGLFEW
jgi:hypothetical protein